MEVETAEISASYFDCIRDNIFRYLFSFLQCIALTNIASSVRVSLSEKLEDSNLKETIYFRVRTE